jgi:ABC-2 type transport system ATP-binding protein
MTPAAIAPIIEVQQVSKSFPKSFDAATWVRHLGRPPRRVALRDVTLDVKRGELLALLGPNGAGKTTLLKLLATLSIPDGGAIRINGIDAATHPLEVRALIGLCPSEERSFYFRLTARQNLEFFGALVGLRGADLRRRIRETADGVNLGDSLDMRYDAFSSGQRQRLALARALLADPKILLLDEPTRAVDPVQALAIRRLVKDELVRRQGKTVVLATNLLEEAWQLADRIAVIHDGAIGAIGPPHLLSESGSDLAVYDIVFEQSATDVDAHLRQISGVAACNVTSVNGSLTVRVSIETGATALTALLQAVSAVGIVREFRQIDAEPARVFSRVLERARDGNGHD